MMIFLQELFKLVLEWLMPSTDHSITEVPIIPPEPPVVPVLSQPAPYLWDTPEHARHSVRVICDEELILQKTILIDGKRYYPKDVICAVIMGESEFYNNAKNYNRNSKGEITSTDFGICQINDRWHIGPNKDFPSVEYVLANPDKCVRWMCRMFQIGHINAWVAYTNGSYKQHLPQIT